MRFITPPAKHNFALGVNYPAQRWWLFTPARLVAFAPAVTPYFTPKAASSLGEVFLEPEVAKILKGLKKSAKSEFVIESDSEPKPEATYDHYRAAAVLNGLISWLRKHGLDTDNPLHTLRKEFGRLMTEGHGIYAASKMLRHSSIMVTASYYAADQRRLTVGLGSALKTKR